MEDWGTFLVGLALGGGLAAALLRLLVPVRGRRAAPGTAPESAAEAETAPEPVTPRTPDPAAHEAGSAAQPGPAIDPAVAEALAALPPVVVAAPAASEPVPAEAAAASAVAEAGEEEAPDRASEGNRRRHPRIRSEDPIMVTPFGGRETMAEVCDVSQGGVRFRVVGLPLRGGDMVRVTFNLGGTSLSAVARVLRTRSLDDITLEIGAEFARLDPWAARQFETALAEEQAEEKAEDGADEDA